MITTHSEFIGIKNICQNYNMKKLLVLLILAFTSTANAQDDKTVTLTVSGQGKTQDEAKQVALRSAIEQAFGAFISSKTEILNDNLVKDEIVSVTNGNIQKYDVLSEVQIPDGGYATTLKAVVSVSKLTSFCESKGVAVEFKGALIAFNAKLDNLNSEAEIKAVENLAVVCSQILSKSIDYSLVTDEPKCKDNECTIQFKVSYKLNNNITLFYDYLRTTIGKLEMNDEEQKKYIQNDRKLNPLVFGKMSSGIPKIFEYHYLRNMKSIQILNNILYNSSQHLFQFKIKSEAGIINVGDINYEESNLINLTFGFPAATFIDFLNGSKTDKEWGGKGLEETIGSSYGILILPINTKPNSELGNIKFTKKMSLNDIGIISKFEIIPISKD